MKFKKAKRARRPIIRPSKALGDRLGLNVIAKDPETENFLFRTKDSLAYEKDGMVWRRHPNGTLECLGPVYDAWREIGT